MSDRLPIPIAGWRFTQAGPVTRAGWARGVILSSGTAQFVPTEKGVAYYNDGVADASPVVSGGESEVQITGPFTFAAWIYIDAYSSADGHTVMSIVGDPNGETEPDNFLTNITLRSDAVGQFHEYGGGTNEIVSAAVPGPSTGAWHHFVFVRDSANKVMEWWWDGELRASASYNNEPTGGQNAILCIGEPRRASNNTAFIGEAWNGYIVDPVVWDQALARAEIERLHLLHGELFRPASRFVPAQIAPLIIAGTGWRVRAEKAKPSAWRVKAGASRPVSWSVINRKSGAVAWDLMASMTTQTAWGVRGGNAVGVGWRAYDARSAGTAWAVATSSVSPTGWTLKASTAMPMSWRVKAAVAGATAWKVLSSGAAAIAVAWKINAGKAVQGTAWRIKTAATKAASWRVYVAHGRQVEWRDKASTSSGAAWAVKGRAVQGAAWSVKTTDAAQSSWRVRTSEAGTASWRVTARAAAQTAWAAATAKAMSTAWRGFVARAKILAWRIGIIGLKPAVVIDASTRRRLEYAAEHQRIIMASTR